MKNTSPNLPNTSVCTEKWESEDTWIALLDGIKAAKQRQCILSYFQEKAQTGKAYCLYGIPQRNMKSAML
jgi:hypothetical protein